MEYGSKLATISDIMILPAFIDNGDRLSSSEFYACFLLKIYIFFFFNKLFKVIGTAKREVTQFLQEYTKILEQELTSIQD